MPAPRQVFVVKVQRNIINAECPEESILMYDKERNVVVQQKPTKSVLSLFPPGQHKIFRYAVMSGEYRLVLGKAARTQRW